MNCDNLDIKLSYISLENDIDLGTKSWNLLYIIDQFFEYCASYCAIL